MSYQVPHLIAAREQPDGTFSLEEQRPELGKRIRDGDPTLGWFGDDRLSLHGARDDDGGVRFEVWRRHDDGTSTVVASKRGTIGTGDSLIRLLAAHDTRGRDLAAETIALRDRVKAAQRNDFMDEVEGKADKLAWALGKDLGTPAQSGKMFRLGGN
jgi:hypothetical protein